jgi:hypothetical protein
MKKSSDTKKDSDMKESSDTKKTRKGRQFTVRRNFNGTLTAQDYIVKLTKAYINKGLNK